MLNREAPAKPRRTFRAIRAQPGPGPIAQATPKLHQCDIKATPRPIDSQPIGTPKPPPCDPNAIPMRPQSHLRACVSNPVLGIRAPHAWPRRSLRAIPATARPGPSAPPHSAKRMPPEITTSAFRWTGLNRPEVAPFGIYRKDVPPKGATCAKPLDSIGKSRLRLAVDIFSVNAGCTFRVDRFPPPACIPAGASPPQPLSTQVPPY